MRSSSETILKSSSKFGELLRCPEPFPCYKTVSSTADDDDEEDWSKQQQKEEEEEEGGGRYNNNNNGSGTPSSGSDVASPYATPPWSQSASPYTKSPWSINVDHHYDDDFHYNTSTPAAANSSDIIDHNVDDCLMITMIGSIVREEGHVYSLATCGDLLYTGSDSKNIRVWRNLREFSGFKATTGGGLVKAIAISRDHHGHTIFTGHTDGKIRIWRRAGPANNYKRVGSLPTLTDCLNKSINPNNYVHVRRNRSSLWIKHYDAVSCLSLNQELGLLYSGSWDKTVKVWDFRKRRCLESIQAHQDAVNAVLDAGFDSLLFTGSADGSLKVWRRRQGGTHFLLQVLLRQDKAITSLAVNKEAAAVYCGSSDGMVNFWEKNLSHGGVLRGHKQPVLCLVAAGILLFTGSADRSICVWKRGEGGIHTCLTVLRAHTGPVKCLAVEQHDGDGGSSWTVYSGSLDKSVKVWRVEDTTNSPHFISQY